MRARLIEVNRQTALHRRKLCDEEVDRAESNSLPERKTRLTMQQLARIEANTKTALKKSAGD